MSLRPKTTQILQKTPHAICFFNHKGAAFPYRISWLVLYSVHMDGE